MKYLYMLLLPLLILASCGNNNDELRKQSAMRIQREAMDLLVFENTNATRSIAINMLNRAIETAPELDVLYINKANLLSRNGEHDKALATIDKALALTPNAAEYWISKGYILQAATDSVQAIAMFNKAIDIYDSTLDTAKNKEQNRSDRAYVQRLIE